MIDRGRERLRALLQRKFVRDTLALQIGKVLVAGLGAVSALVVFRLLGPEALGIYGLAQSFLALLTSLDLTGLGASTTTRLGIALGANDRAGIRDLLAFYIKVSALLNLCFITLLLTIGGPLAALVQGDARIGALAAGLAIAGLADGLYVLIMIALQAGRSMRAAAILQVINQVLLSSFLIAAAVIAPTPEGLVTGRIAYAFTSMGAAVVIYNRLRGVQTLPYPPLADVFRRAVRVPVRPYWRFGVANAVDRSLSNFYIQVPVQLVGVFGGPVMVGYLDLAMSGIEQGRILTLALTENIAAVIPQAVGRGQYRQLWRSFTRGVAALLIAALVYYGLIALAAPFVVGWLIGAQWLPALPAVAGLVIFGAVTTAGSTFGPLYRALDLLRPAIFVKVCTLIAGLPLAALVIAGVTDTALGGALAISGIYCLSVGLTAVFTLRALRRAARTTRASAD